MLILIGLCCHSLDSVLFLPDAAAEAADAAGAADAVAAAADPSSSWIRRGHRWPANRKLSLIG